MHKRILDAFNDVPKFEGFTAKDVAEKLDMPEPTARLHLEYLTASKSLVTIRVGKTKLYNRTKPKKKA
jgi:predicted ArsR family transcriptional regulator